METISSMSATATVTSSTTHSVSNLRKQDSSSRVQALTTALLKSSNFRNTHGSWPANSIRSLLPVQHARHHYSVNSSKLHWKIKNKNKRQPPGLGKLPLNS